MRLKVEGGKLTVAWTGIESKNIADLLDCRKVGEKHAAPRFPIASFGRVLGHGGSALCSFPTPDNALEQIPVFVVKKVDMGIVLQRS